MAVTTAVSERVSALYNSISDLVKDVNLSTKVAEESEDMTFHWKTRREGHGNHSDGFKGTVRIKYGEKDLLVEMSPIHPFQDNPSIEISYCSSHLKRAVSVYETIETFLDGRGDVATSSASGHKYYVVDESK